MVLRISQQAPRARGSGPPGAARRAGRAEPRPLAVAPAQVASGGSRKGWLGGFEASDLSKWYGERHRPARGGGAALRGEGGLQRPFARAAAAPKTPRRPHPPPRPRPRPVPARRPAGRRRRARVPRRHAAGRVSGARTGGATGPRPPPCRSAARGPLAAAARGQPSPRPRPRGAACSLTSEAIVGVQTDPDPAP
jgi:hypothetical protein